MPHETVMASAIPTMRAAASRRSFWSSFFEPYLAVWVVIAAMVPPTSWAETLRNAAMIPLLTCSYKMALAMSSTSLRLPRTMASPIWASSPAVRPRALAKVLSTALTSWRASLVVSW